MATYMPPPGSANRPGSYVQGRNQNLLSAATQGASAGAAALPKNNPAAAGGYGTMATRKPAAGSGTAQKTTSGGTPILAPALGMKAAAGAGAAAAGASNGKFTGWGQSQQQSQLAPRAAPVQAGAGAALGLVRQAAPQQQQTQPRAAPVAAPAGRPVNARYGNIPTSTGDLKEDASNATSSDNPADYTGPGIVSNLYTGTSMADRGVDWSGKGGGGGSDDPTGSEQWAALSPEEQNRLYESGGAGKHWTRWDPNLPHSDLAPRVDFEGVNSKEVLYGDKPPEFNPDDVNRSRYQQGFEDYGGSEFDVFGGYEGDTTAGRAGLASQTNQFAQEAGDRGFWDQLAGQNRQRLEADRATQIASNLAAQNQSGIGAGTGLSMLNQAATSAQYEDAITQGNLGVEEQRRGAMAQAIGLQQGTTGLMGQQDLAANQQRLSGQGMVADDSRFQNQVANQNIRAENDLQASLEDRQYQRDFDKQKFQQDQWSQVLDGRITLAQYNANVANQEQVENRNTYQNYIDLRYNRSRDKENRDTQRAISKEQSIATGASGGTQAVGTYYGGKPS